MSSRDGFLVVNKPAGITSFDIIRKMRSLFSCKKIGHAGTLDPDAEGVVILAFGVATRLLPYLNTEPKVYRFEVQFGRETDTLDRSGKILRDGGILPDVASVAAVLPQFIGTQEQTPPIYSAIKVDGKRSYDLARKGAVPILKSRQITINSLDLLKYDEANGRALCEVSCSGGTYVRSLACDIALRLSTFGHAYSIIRSACGTFSLDTALSLNAITTESAHIPIAAALRSIPSFQADDHILEAIGFGRTFVVESLSTGTDEFVMAFKGDQFVALARRCDAHSYHPEVVALGVN